jgi:hypothetical protein
MLASDPHEAQAMENWFIEPADSSKFWKDLHIRSSKKKIATRADWYLRVKGYNLHLI